MISRCFGVDDLGQYGNRWLKNSFLTGFNQERHININLDRKLVRNDCRNKYVDEKELEQYRFYHPYMYERKMTDEVIDIFDIGYDSKTQSITFPVRDKNGNCLFIARRSTIYKLFNYPSDAEKPIYGIYELYKLKEFPKEIYICESMIDALTLWRS